MKTKDRKLCSDMLMRNYAVLNISPFPKEHVRMHDSLASNHERGRSGMVWELKMVYEEENQVKKVVFPVIKV